MVLEVALQYNDGYAENIFSFANNINTREAGTHWVGFKAALTRTINNYANANDLLKKDAESLTGDDVREGFTAVISVKLRNPQFEGQTKAKLGNSEVKGIVEAAVNEALGAYFEENPPIARRIAGKAVDPGRDDKEVCDIAGAGYHKIILMTDADVDGSHIRTLLLTFFFRQMTELIDRGYIYIAQPPLFKVKKGKTEKYLKDENALNEYLADLAVEEVEVYVESGQAFVTGRRLLPILKKLIAFEGLLTRFGKKQHEASILRAFVDEP